MLLEIISENCMLLYPPYQTVFRGFESENCLYIKDNVALLFLIFYHEWYLRGEIVFHVEIKIETEMLCAGKWL